jgi:hypothetical protein
LYDGICCPKFVAAEFRMLMQVSSNRYQFFEQIWCDKLVHGDRYPDEKIRGIESNRDLKDPLLLYLMKQHHS